ncbi:hypothetical protein ANCDUO_20461 [Ancylostoma duodenale]|uniref:Uncharacterized protein n=1 Tax=Ancylostoma duodenale TaxID=51022 RepID=A0A0C2FS21_9BILA|nr:hypothetical protein ANCDUO_20461 [Ancylostoma duodenale]
MQSNKRLSLKKLMKKWQLSIQRLTAIYM